MQLMCYAISPLALRLGAPSTMPYFNGPGCLVRGAFIALNPQIVPDKVPNIFRFIGVSMF